MDLDLVAIELDLMNPSDASRHIVDRVAIAGSMNPGYGVLTPIAAGVFR
jgi:hypothetical protein